ncbi:MAG TPA: hypothetical protein VFP82_02685 [Chthoniobacterales bacterium]|nr:hypothetical protein [Chthoniobacterales bacterium]
MSIPTIKERRRIPSPTVTPQALAWDGNQLWVSSRDLGFIYKLNSDGSKIVEEVDPPGVIWAAVATNGAMHVTIGKGTNDDRYVYRYETGKGFSKLFACPDFAGSYLSYDGKDLYLSQWYQQRILKMDKDGKIVGKIDIGAEICGHTFANGALYVLRGTENVPRPQYADGPPTAERFRSGAKPGEEQWWIARVEKGAVADVAKVPFAARSLTFDGKNFWSNHRAANETVCFSLPS